MASRENAMTTKMAGIALFFFSLIALSIGEISNRIGLNYGQMGNNLPSPHKSIQIIKSMKAGCIKLYDSNPEILRLLSGTKIRVSIMVTNKEIINISSNQTLADNWVQDNVLAYYPDTMIRFIMVGNEVLSYYTEQDRLIWQNLVPAMQNIKKSLRAQHIQNIKVSTPLAMDVLQTSFPASKGVFRPDISSAVMEPLLDFLNRTKSFFFIDVYPYFPWSTNPNGPNLDSALFRSNTTYTDPLSRLNYTNLLDQMLDSLIFAMKKLGYDNVQLAISETGWPNAGDIDQIGANIHNAATYNRNLIKKMAAKPPIGTPARPGVVIPTFIFSLFNENEKTGPGTERHWGLNNANGLPMYEVDLTGKRTDSEFAPLPPAQNNKPFKGKMWCVVAEEADPVLLGKALTYACSQGNRTCEALTPGSECYQPLSIRSHASYAFSSYWAQLRSQGATCYFDGLARQTSRDPSLPQCRFPSVTL